MSEEEENASETEQGSGAEAVSDDEVSEDLLEFLEQLTLLEPSEPRRRPGNLTMWGIFRRSPLGSS